ncbi:MAG: hypothetical protein EP330_28600 [Deltaproteobacteria bacterium]|nr:MAG: hypothetical protein EP330_28600 [Deltaproteobacteria bacterium]
MTLLALLLACGSAEPELSEVPCPTLMELMLQYHPDKLDPGAKERRADSCLGDAKGHVVRMDYLGDRPGSALIDNDAAGRPTAIRMDADGQKVNYRLAYTDAGKLASYEVDRNADGSWDMALTYGYDGRGQRTVDVADFDGDGQWDVRTHFEAGRIAAIEKRSGDKIEKQRVVAWDETGRPAEFEPVAP